MTTKQEIAELKEVIRQLTERIEQLEARPQIYAPYVPQQIPVFYQPEWGVPNPYWYNPVTSVCMNE